MSVQPSLFKKQMALDFEAPSRDDVGEFEVTVKRSPRRRTIEIIVRNGGVDLMLPQFVSDDEGFAFVRSKKAWIEKTLAKHQEIELEKPVRHYQDGEQFEYLGQPFTLSIYIAKKPEAKLVNGQLFVGVKGNSRSSKSDSIKKQVWTWYQREAQKILTTKTLSLAEQIGRECKSVKLRRTKSKWGHCTPDGDIQYNWQIIAAPEPVVDYLVAHEVSHLVHLNHGKRFWRHVEKLCPDYLEHEQWLKVNGHKIDL